MRPKCMHLVAALRSLWWQCIQLWRHEAQDARAGGAAMLHAYRANGLALDGRSWRSPVYKESITVLAYLERPACQLLQRWA